MQSRLLPVFALTLGSVLVVSCSKQEPAPPPAAAATAPKAAEQAAGPSGGQTTNFESNTQTQAPVPAPPSG